MNIRHNIVHLPPWPVTCHDCGNLWIAGPHGDNLWWIRDLRAVDLARTGILSAWLKRVHLVVKGGSVIGDDRALMLVLVAHHHQRGQRLPMSETMWHQAAVLAALASQERTFDGPWAAAEMLLDQISVPRAWASRAERFPVPDMSYLRRR